MCSPSHLAKMASIPSILRKGVFFTQRLEWHNAKLSWRWRYRTWQARRFPLNGGRVKGGLIGDGLVVWSNGESLEWAWKPYWSSRPAKIPKLQRWFSWNQWWRSSPMHQWVIYHSGGMIQIDILTSHVGHGCGMVASPSVAVSFVVLITNPFSASIIVVVLIIHDSHW